ncbi:hypothetical protein OIN60_07595 [Paenibacillus sp. P96]|uniref:Helicase XPB/Ssl2 N-terminal domain-containing protein n=1 Tax=Paenibacillus zeirhizosphaerae TaxID=2987519 RepID=A0ABT9FPH1_9BACL|nr:hypothetical protein [Paenibacillus sp. P96]MDP4096631.1 hypothetical protein [Paenibacillus sp. P96]
MNLADMLTYADIGQLNRIASHYECECKPNSKHELIQGILTKLGRREFFAQQVQALPLPYRRFLNTLLFDERPYFSMEELVAAARQALDEQTEITPREIVARLRSAGWLFNGSTHQTRYLYQVPADLKQRLSEVTRQQMREMIVSTDEPAIYRDEGHLLGEDLKLMLRFISSHEVVLNPEGVMYRRTQQQVMEHLHVAEPLLGKGGWRFGYGMFFKNYPDRFALMYDYAFHRKWIAEANGLLVLTAKGEEALDMSTEEELVQLFRFWLRLYKGAVPNISSLIYWTSVCAKSWVSKASLFEQIGPFIKPFYYDTSEAVFDKRIIRLLMHFGMIRLGEHPTAGTVLQMTAWGMMTASCCSPSVSRIGVKKV